MITKEQAAHLNDLISTLTFMCAGAAMRRTAEALRVYEEAGKRLSDYMLSITEPGK